MRFVLRVCGALALGASVFPAAAPAADAQTPLANVELIEAAPRPGLANLPPGAPRAVLYFLGKAKVPSCGLLPAGPGAASITPILETEPGDDFPSCEEVTDGAAFEFGGTPGYVFRYVQRDTREDTTTGYFFVQAAAGGVRPLDKLNSETPPAKKSIKSLAAWGKSRLVSLENDKDAFLSSASDSIVTDSAFLNVSRNASAGKCRVVVDLVAGHGNLAPVTTACQKVLASTAWAGGEATYFIVLTENPNHQARGQIFVVRNSAVSEATDFEERLSSEIASRMILKVKESLRAMVTSRSPAP